MNGLSKVSELLSQADSWLASGVAKINDSAKSEAKFETALAAELGKVFGQSQQVDAAVASYNAGSEDGSIERTAFLMAKAEADLRLAVQVRNKAVSAYQEVMNMQI